MWAQRHGRGQPSLVGEVVIEDLRDVLTRILMRKGANGPQGPVTQYLLAAGAEHLATRMGEDFRPQVSGESVPRILSALIGHEPFVEDTLGLSVNQLRRRWPAAADWYSDLVAYILRPQRHDINMEDVLNSLPAWQTLRLGDLVAAVTEHQLIAAQSDLYRLADTIRWLWPTHPAVREAQRAELAAVVENWYPILFDAMQRYRLRLREGVGALELTWLANSLTSWEAHERLVDSEFMRYQAPDGSGSTTMGARAIMIFLTGMVLEEDGRPIDLDELYERRPQV